MKQKLMILSCLALIAFGAVAQQKEVISLTLQQAVELAKKNNYAMQNSRIDQKISEKKVSEIVASGLPQINANGSFNDYLDIPKQLVQKSLFIPGASPNDYMIFGFGVPYSASGGVTASQLIFDGTYLVGVKAAKEYVNLARLGVKRTETEIAAGISKIYYAALLTQVNVKMLDNTILTLEKVLKDNRAYNKSGLTEKIDLDRLELSFSNTQIQRDKIADQYVLSMMMLKLQLGLNVKDSVLLSDDLEKLFKSEIASPVDSKIDYAQRPEHKMLEQQIRLQSFDIKRYQFGYAPSLVASLTAQRIAYGPTFGNLGTDFGNVGQVWFPTTIFTLNLSIPVFDGFRKSAQIQQSKLTLMKYENDKKNLENTIENEVEQSKLKLERAKQQLEVQKKNMELSQEIYNRASIKYKNGVGSTLELTTAENDMKTSQTNYLGCLYDMLVAQIDLRKSLGLL